MKACPDTAHILRNLKGFQRDTVAYVFQRLYADTSPARRFLIADEVGLGKTLVARGLIARTVEHLWSRRDQINIVYICSNADIADQNIKRLQITDQHYAFSTRPTLLPFYTKDLAHNHLNFISFTPGTAFHLKKGGGVLWERVLLYWLLNDAWGINQLAGSIEVLRDRVDYHRFAARLSQHVSYDRSLTNPFVSTIKQRIDLRDRFVTLCRQAEQYGHVVDTREQRACIGALRQLLAQACFHGLKPTLIILDEFQRFKDVLDPAQANDDGEDDDSLAAQFFKYADQHADARVLLLSATPYKMYTLSHESEDHYQDFLQTLAFLRNGPVDDIKACVEQYRLALLRLGGEGSIEETQAIKTALQQLLQQVMVRTERLAATADRNGMLKPNLDEKLMVLSDKDIDAYIALQDVAYTANHHDPIEYWKSAPYLLNFMGKDEYKFKQRVLDAIDNPLARDQIANAFSMPGNMLLNWRDIIDYKEIDPANARLRSLMADVVDNGAWQLLWTPPAFPYYSSLSDKQSPYSQPQLAGFTKRLVFSSWRVVPRVVASMLSYAVEQRIVAQSDVQVQSTSDARAKRGHLLRIGPAEKGRPSTMSLFCLFYPCLTLAVKFDPLAIARKSYQHKGIKRPSLDSMRSYIAGKIEELLDQALPKNPTEGPEDESWYWAAPLLLDRMFYRQATQDWFSEKQLATFWASARTEDDTEYDVSVHWQAHVDYAKGIFEGHFLAPRGRRPKDLAQVLAEMAMAAPGIVALRALWRAVDTPANLVADEAKMNNHSIRDTAAWTAWSFRGLFNQPDVTDMLRARNGKMRYWRHVLAYCVEGNLQATLDEYVHVLRESLSLLDQDPDTIAYTVAGEIAAALNLQTATVAVDDLDVDNAQRIREPKRHTMRNHFATRFSDDRAGEAVDKKQHDRSLQVQRAFNSPFWPFVLVTTSVGQEGLDFHQYCHAVVHWNLPSNPVDLEQREGRVHRYKGHAIRKNVAQRYKIAAVAQRYQGSQLERDPWEALFAAGAADSTLPQDARDLAPYWVCPGAAQIERHIPALPLSRDIERRDDLVRALTLYRMVFGQARQEDLIRHLRARLSEDEIQRIARDLSIRLEPPMRQTAPVDSLIQATCLALPESAVDEQILQSPSR